MRRAALFCALVVGLCGCRKVTGFGVAVTVEGGSVDRALLQGAARLSLRVSGDEDETPSIELTGTHFAGGEERFVYRPRSTSRVLHIAVDLVDALGMVGATASSGEIRLTPGAIVEADLVLHVGSAASDGGSDIGSTDDAGALDGGTHDAAADFDLGVDAAADAGAEPGLTSAPSGFFEAPAHLPGHAIQVEVAELNGDGALDAVAMLDANGERDMVVLLNEQGTLRERYRTAVPPAATGFALVDSGGSTDLDIVWWSPVDNLTELVNDGTGAFGSGGTLYYATDTYVQVLAANLEGFGVEDLVVLTSAGEVKTLVRGGGSGYVETAVAFNGAAALIAVGAPPTGDKARVFMYGQSSSGTLGVYSTSTTTALAASIGDVAALAACPPSLSGCAAAVVRNDQSVELYDLSGPGGAPSSFSVLPPTPILPTSLLVADVVGDVDPDLVLGDADGLVAVYPGGGGVNAGAPVTYAFAGAVASLAAGHIDDSRAAQLLVADQAGVALTGAINQRLRAPRFVELRDASTWLIASAAAIGPNELGAPEIWIGSGGSVQGYGYVNDQLEVRNQLQISSTAQVVALAVGDEDADSVADLLVGLRNNTDTYEVSAVRGTNTGFVLEIPPILSGVPPIVRMGIAPLALVNTLFVAHAAALQLVDPGSELDVDPGALHFSVPVAVGGGEAVLIDDPQGYPALLERSGSTTIRGALQVGPVNGGGTLDIQGDGLPDYVFGLATAAPLQVVVSSPSGNVVTSTGPPIEVGSGEIPAVRLGELRQSGVVLFDRDAGLRAYVAQNGALIPAGAFIGAPQRDALALGAADLDGDGFTDAVVVHDRGITVYRGQP